MKSDPLKGKIHTSTLITLTIGTLCTLAITPWMNFDPINLPKLFILSSFSPVALYIFWQQIKSKSNLQLQKAYSFILFLFVLSLIPTLLVNSQSLPTQFWGTWGRSTGLLAFFSLVSLFLVSSLIMEALQITILVKYFLRLSYFITIYTTMQFGQLDPVSWSQQLPVATLGNINFMSAFLGFASIACLHHVLQSDRNWMQKTFFIILIFWNMSLCWFSGSIQGILMWLVGALVLLSSKLGVLSWSRLRLCILGIALIPIVFLLILGGLGRGALGKILIQETFLFRIDYWLAGLRMTLKNPLLGVGIDSYGDYYRTYRDVTATYRTGSQRVSNTAHNIFLDISSGSGLITLVIILVFFVSILLIGFNSIRKNGDSHTTLLFALASAYVVFSMISINQLGVSCWGWIFFGVLLGRVSYNNQKFTQISASLERRDTTKKVNTKVARESRSLPLDSHRKFDLSVKVHKGASLFAMCALFLLGASIALPPLVKDAQYLHVYKLRDSQKMYEVALSELTPDLLREHALKFFVENQEVELATNLARRAIEINPRNFTAQNVIRLLVSTSVSEKLSAISQLEAIEPNDREFLQQLDAQRRELVSQNR